MTYDKKYGTEYRACSDEEAVEATSQYESVWGPRLAILAFIALIGLGIFGIVMSVKQRMEFERTHSPRYGVGQVVTHMISSDKRYIIREIRSLPAYETYEYFVIDDPSKPEFHGFWIKERELR